MTATIECRRVELESLASKVESESIWVNHEDYPVGDWIQEVSNGDTRIGYKEWVLSAIRSELSELQQASS